eukprot:352886-Chlamydomonas_euryale.AAC.2
MSSTGAVGIMHRSRSSAIYVQSIHTPLVAMLTPPSQEQHQRHRMTAQRGVPLPPFRSWRTADSESGSEF